MYTVCKPSKSLAQVVTDLLKSGARDDVRNKEGECPVHVYTKRKDFHCLVALLLYGKPESIDVANKDDQTALHIAVEVRVSVVQGRSKGGLGGACPPKILVQHIICNRIHVDVIVRAVPQIEHIPVLQAARKFRTRKCGQKNNPRCIDKLAPPNFCD